MFKWDKLGKVFDPTTVNDRPWLKEFAQAPSTLIFDNFVRVYFSCRPPADSNGQYASYSAFVDLDRNDLTKVVAVAEQPILPLGGLGEFDEFGTYPVSVCRHKNKVVAYYAGWTRCESVPFNTAIGMATSDNEGISFQKVGSGPIIPYSPFEPFVMSGPKIRYFNNQWYLFYIAGTQWILDEGKPEPVYKIRSATSSDGKNWVKTNSCLIPDAIDENEAQASPDVFFSNGRYHMFFCYRHGKGYRGKEKGYRIGYAYSEDLLNWERDDSKVGIDVSDSGWDSEMISYPHIFELDGNIYMFYLGNQVGRCGFGLAKLNGKL
ncbi:hypothetical protein KO495_01185 [Colwellia sp. D2M02]|uniref:hypothetical protein n=1 Tax=Colwellia sp. D2M02 TaxID=2841562 RepID=UPI001C09D1A8|nr:hypothetical protein [Colwellia sp. D2M02]MBU2891932.1 hypothetical protein [Colwellia sp. D2M02]